jgi:CelD/BcsL family acetyltransferase involved in cellulose biosynthesis
MRLHLYRSAICSVSVSGSGSGDWKLQENPDAGDGYSDHARLRGTARDTGDDAMGRRTVAYGMAIVDRPKSVQTAKPTRGRLRVRSALVLDAVDALEGPWREMESRVESPFGQFGWTRACLSAFPADATPHLMAGFAQQQLVALAPLVKKREHGVCRLFLAGVRELFEPMDVVWTDEQALTRLTRSVARGGYPLVFERMPSDSASLRALQRAYRGRAIVLVAPRPACPYVCLDESWLTPDRHLSAKDRVALVWARHSAEEFGEVTTEIHTPDLRDLAELLDRAVDVEARGRGNVDSRDGKACAASRGAAAPLAGDPQRMVFYRQYAQAACVEGNLRVCFLRIGDCVAAMQLAVEQGGAFWLLRAGSDARFADCSPGLLLAHDTIRYAAEAGLTSYEFLNTADEWTAAWSTAEHPCSMVRVYPFGVRGLSALAADMGVALYRRLRKTDR